MPGVNSSHCDESEKCRNRTRVPPSGVTAAAWASCRGQGRSSVRSAGRAGPATSRIAGRCRRHFGIKGEAHVAYADAHALDLIQQFLVDAEAETGFLDDVVRIERLVQSQRKARAASASRGQKDADGLLFLPVKVRFKLFAGVFGYGQHICSLSMLM